MVGQILVILFFDNVHDIARIIGGIQNSGQISFLTVGQQIPSLLTGQGDITVFIGQSPVKLSGREIISTTAHLRFQLGLLLLELRNIALGNVIILYNIRIRQHGAGQIADAVSDRLLCQLGELSGNGIQRSVHTVLHPAKGNRPQTACHALFGFRSGSVKQISGILKCLVLFFDNGRTDVSRIVRSDSGNGIQLFNISDIHRNLGILIAGIPDLLFKIGILIVNRPCELKQITASGHIAFADGLIHLGKGRIIIPINPVQDLVCRFRSLCSLDPFVNLFIQLGKLLLGLLCGSFGRQNLLVHLLGGFVLPILHTVVLLEPILIKVIHIEVQCGIINRTADRIRIIGFTLGIQLIGNRLIISPRSAFTVIAPGHVSVDTAA